MKGRAYECIQGRFRNRGMGSSEANQIPNADVRMQPDRWQEYNSLWSHRVTNLIIGTSEWFRIWYRVDEYSMEAMWIVIRISEYRVWCWIIESEYLDVMSEWWLVTVSPFIVSPYHGRDTLTLEQCEWNKAMGRVRISVEHGFGLVLQDWPFLHAFWKMKIFRNACETLYRVAVLLTNAHTCLVPNQTSTRYNCMLPTLEEYFHS